MSFDGFPRETFSFLRGLSKNNTKVWFEAHKGDYDSPPRRLASAELI